MIHRFQVIALLLLVLVIVPQAHSEDNKIVPDAAQTTAGTALGQADSEELYHMLLICREKKGGKIEVLSSQIVPGKLKPAYRIEVKPQMVRLTDEKGVEVSRAFYDVIRKVRWTDVKPDTKELSGGEVEMDEVVYPVRVPYSAKGKLLKLSRIKNPQALESRRQKTPQSEPLKIEVQETEDLMTVPLSYLPGAPEVKK